MSRIPTRAAVNTRFVTRCQDCCWSYGHVPGQTWVRCGHRDHLGNQINGAVKKHISWKNGCGVDCDFIDAKCPIATTKLLSPEGESK